MSDWWENDPFEKDARSREEFYKQEEARIADELSFLTQAREQLRQEGLRHSEMLRGADDPFDSRYALPERLPQQKEQITDLVRYDASVPDEETENAAKPNEPAAPRRRERKKRRKRSISFDALFQKLKKTRKPKKTEEESGKSAAGLYSVPPRGGRNKNVVRAKRWFYHLSARARITAIAGACLLIAAIALMIPALSKNDGGEAVIPKNVTIDGVDVSGMTRQEAIDSLRRTLDEKLAGTVVTLSYAGEKWTLDNLELGLGDDLEATVERALEIKTPTRLFDRIGELFKRNKQARDLSTSVTVSEAILRSTLAQKCGIVDEMVVEGSVSFDPTAVGEQGLFTITAPRSGRTIDMTRLVADIRSAVYAGGAHEITVRSTVAYPAHTLSELKQSVSCIAEASVSLLSAGDAAGKNAETAVKRLSGSSVAAGQNLSFNAVAAPYSGENGYTMLKDDASGDYVAPGVELVATLFYRAGLLADMKPLTRTAPKTPVDYEAVGLDAQVGRGQDLVLKNASDYPIYIYAAVQGDTLYIALYGMPLADSASVSLQTQVLSYTETPKAQIVDDTAGAYGLAPGETLELSPSHPGCRVSVYRVTIDKFGNESGQELISTDTYAPVAGPPVRAAQ